jgi:uncharacterized protein (TIGR03067 family)
MRFPLLVALAVGLFTWGEVSAVPNKPPKKEKDRGTKEIQGTWTVVSVEVAGRKVPEDALKDIKLIITADKLVSKRGDKIQEESTYKLDRAKKPKQIDYISIQGPNKGKTQKAICEREGDTLKIGQIMNGAERPKNFSVKEEPNLIVLILKRAKS